jgi:hypothetical protein
LAVQSLIFPNRLPICGLKSKRSPKGANPTMQQTFLHAGRPTTKDAVTLSSIDPGINTRWRNSRNTRRGIRVVEVESRLRGSRAHRPVRHQFHLEVLDEPLRTSFRFDSGSCLPLESQCARSMATTRARDSLLRASHEPPTSLLYQTRGSRGRTADRGAGQSNEAAAQLSADTPCRRASESSFRRLDKVLPHLKDQQPPDPAKMARIKKDIADCEISVLTKSAFGTAALFWAPVGIGVITAIWRIATR